MTTDDIVCETFEDEAAANEPEEVTEAMFEVRWQRYRSRPLSERQIRPDGPTPMAPQLPIDPPNTDIAPEDTTLEEQDCAPEPEEDFVEPQDEEEDDQDCEPDNDYALEPDYEQAENDYEGWLDEVGDR